MSLLTIVLFKFKAKTAHRILKDVYVAQNPKQVKVYPTPSGLYTPPLHHPNPYPTRKIYPMFLHKHVTVVQLSALNLKLLHYKVSHIKPAIFTQQVLY